MEARDQLLLLGRTTFIDVSPAASAPVGSLMVEDEQTGEVRPISKKERQRLKKDARKAKKELQSQAGRKPAVPTENGEVVLQIGGEVFYGEEEAAKSSAAQHAAVEAAEEPEVVGSHVVAPVSTGPKLERYYQLTHCPSNSALTMGHALWRPRGIFVGFLSDFKRPAFSAKRNIPVKAMPISSIHTL